MGQPEEDLRGVLVRPYALTRGRTEPLRKIAIEAILLTEALAIAPEVPLILCDARQRESVKHILIGVVEHAIASLRVELAQAGG